MPNEAISPSAQVKRLLRQSGLRARKSLGQHFLADASVLQTIVEAAELSPADTVIEVGPGLGILTAELVRRAGNIVAVELDAKLASLLKRRLASPANLRVINADVLKVSPSELLEGTSHYKVVANLPYYITSPVLRYFVEASPKPSLMVVMVQKEVGEAIVAGQGKMSLLAVSLQAYSKPSIISHVPAQCFYPKPKVDSVIVRFDLLPEPAVKVADMDGFFDLARAGFSSPRKQLHNSLARSLGMKPAEITLLLEGANIDSKRRAETLSLEEWARLYEVRETAKGEMDASV
ncbi:MAG: 16S rRNA (adenine(1518)-N(6)/adenine(1519)-N(6))-dimethyltransferase RsmA [Dehalococcoidia bacterium]|nr:16S rRNA (adenine(1518)-N(6)/adenine(1519)-N(6))-dimethyltransferase RsmA [Dehalococcoidia bacterium]